MVHLDRFKNRFRFHVIKCTFKRMIKPSIRNWFLFRYYWIHPAPIVCFDQSVMLCVSYGLANIVFLSYSRCLVASCTFCTCCLKICFLAGWLLNQASVSFALLCAHVSSFVASLTVWLCCLLCVHCISRCNGHTINNTVRDSRDSVPMGNGIWWIDWSRDPDR